MRSMTHAVVGGLLATLACAQGAGAAARTTSSVPAEQQVVTLYDVKRVSSRPAAGARMVGVVSAVRPITLKRTTLPVLEQKQDAEGRRWLKVRLPGRALNRSNPPLSGWISTPFTRRTTVRWHVVVDVDARQVLAYRDGRLMRSFGAIVGKPSTPTPRGKFFVEEALRMPAGKAGGPFALAASARSHVYQQFAGGPGQIALHGVNGIGGQIGSAVSHGCIRMTTAGVTWLAQYIKAGTPLTIR